MVLEGVGVLWEGGLVEVNESNLGWMIRDSANQAISIMESHGLGLSCGIPLRRRNSPLSLA